MRVYSNSSYKWMKTETNNLAKHGFAPNKVINKYGMRLFVENLNIFQLLFSGSGFKWAKNIKQTIHELQGYQLHEVYLSGYFILMSRV